MNYIFLILCCILLLIVVGASVFFWYSRKTRLADLKDHSADAEIFAHYRSKEISEKKREHWLKPLRPFIRIAGDVFIVLLFAVFAISALDRILGNFDLPLKPLVVASGSMSYKNEANDYLFDDDLREEYDLDNQFATYDLVFVEKAKKEDIHRYDIVCYLDSEGEQIIHRVREITSDGLYLMRGDANAADDPGLVSYDRIVGKFTGFKIPKIGYIIFYLQSDYGILAFCSVCVCIGSYWFFSRGLADREEQRYLSIKALAGDAEVYRVVASDGVASVDGEKVDYREAESSQEEVGTYVLVGEEKRPLEEGDKQ